MFHIWKKPEPVPAARKPVALVVDGSEAFRHAALRLLSRANVAGIAVDDVSRAVAWLRANDAPALVLVDVTAVHEVRAALAGRKSAVIATADVGVDRRDEVAALADGAVSMLVKPLEPAEFLRTIAGVISAATARKRVLLVDDDDDIRESFAMFLEEEGYDVTPAAHGKDAMDALDGGLKPDVILMDLMMPVMNGWQMWDRLKSSQHAQTPVVVITAGLDAPPAPARVLRKPIGLVELLSVVRSAS